MALGVSYEGRDPRLLERMLPLVDYLEVTLETMAEMDGDRLALDPEVMQELKNIGSAAKIRDELQLWESTVITTLLVQSDPRLLPTIADLLG